MAGRVVNRRSAAMDGTRRVLCRRRQSMRLSRISAISHATVITLASNWVIAAPTSNNTVAVSQRFFLFSYYLYQIALWKKEKKLHIPYIICL